MELRKEDVEFAELLYCAIEGDARSQFLLGERYYKGDGVLKNRRMAIAWYSLAAALGNEMADAKLKEIAG